MNEHEQDRMKKLLQQAMPPIDAALNADAAPELWPAMVRRMNAKAAEAHPWLPAWFDWAVLAGIVAVVAAFPSSIPLLLYYL